MSLAAWYTRKLSGDAAQLRVIQQAELVQHASPESCWVVIRGLVYDVTQFHHPGGNDRLFELAGRDATRFFERISHSTAAHRHMGNLLVGKLATVTAADEAPATPPPPATATTTATHGSKPVLIQAGRGERPLKGGAVHREAREGEATWSTRCRGFLPVRDPVSVGEPYAVLQRLVAALPVALVEGTFRELVEAEAASFAPLEPAIVAEQDEDVLERVHGLFGYVGRGYAHGAAASADGSHRVPKFLSDGWLRVSERLGRLPTIDYANCVLYNWERIDAAGPMTPDNIRILNRFTGLLDEEWFMKTHVIIESEASGVVSAVYDGCAAVRNADVSRLLAMLAWLEQALAHVTSNCLWLMFDRQGADGCLCEPELFYHRVRPHITTWTALFEAQYETGDADGAARLDGLRRQLVMLDELSEAGGAHGMPDLAPHRAHLAHEIGAMQRKQRLCGPSGAMSTILPLCDAFVGVGMSSEVLGRMLAAFEAYMPRRHRELLAQTRAACARDFIVQLQADGHPQAEALVDHFNAVVRRVLDFRWRHLSYVEEYVLRPSGAGRNAAGTGGTPAFTYLNQHINDTEGALIRHRGERRSHPDDLLGAPTDADAAGASADADDAAAATPPHRRGHGGAGGDLWLVGEENGLLPSRPPVPCAALPGAAWAAACELARLLPACCVPPATFRRTFAQHAHLLPRVRRRGANGHRDGDGAEGDGGVEDGGGDGGHGDGGGDGDGDGEGAGDGGGDSGDACARMGLETEDARERARCLLAHLVAGWHAAGPPAELPDALREPFEAVSRRVGRAARLGLTDMVLYNWCVREEGGDGRVGGGAGEGETTEEDEEEAAARGWPRLEAMGALRPLHRFVCLEEEEWWCRLHVLLAAQSGDVVGAIERCQRQSAPTEGDSSAAEHAMQLVRTLQQLEQAVEALVRVHHAMGVGHGGGGVESLPLPPPVKPHVLMQRLHRFLPPVPELAARGVGEAEVRGARVFCATGIDQPCLLGLFGVARGDHALDAFREWQQASGSGAAGSDLPPAHLAFLSGCTARTSMRERVERAVGVKRLSVQEVARLELAHNSCVETVLRYFETRAELTQMLCGKDVLKDAWEQERAAIAAARLRLLVERREMVGPKEGLPTEAHLYKRMPGERGV